MVPNKLTCFACLLTTASKVSDEKSVQCKLTQDNAIGLRGRLPDEPDWVGSDLGKEDADWRTWNYYT